MKKNRKLPPVRKAREEHPVEIALSAIALGAASYALIVMGFCL